MQPELTPMLRQYYELKERTQDALLFFRMGDFYEIFGEDAEFAAPLLDIVLTSREKNKEGARIPFCGIPYHSAKAYILKVLSKGYKVAIAEQMEEASASKGLVKRDIVKTYSPGCIDELEGLMPDAPNYLMTIFEVPSTRKFAVALADISTGELRAGSAADEEQLLRLIEHFRPREILCRRFYHETLIKITAAYRTQEQLTFSFLSEIVLRDSAEQQRLLSVVFGPGAIETNANLSANGSIKMGQLARQPQIAGGVEVLTGFFFHLETLKSSLSQFLAVKPLFDPQTISLSDIAIRDLELFETVRRRQTKGSLFSIINYTASPMGARLLRYNLGHPLVNGSEIQRRQQMVRFFVGLGEIKLDAFRQLLMKIPDLERLTTRLAAKNITPVELGKIRHGLMALLNAKDQLIAYNQSSADKSIAGIVSALENCRSPLQLLTNIFADDLGELGEGRHSVFKPGYNEELDALVELAGNGNSKVEQYAEKLRQQTGIASLKIKAHQTFGLLIEITKSQLSKVPENFIRRQTMVNCERFITPELKELDETLASATERVNAHEQHLYVNALLHCSEHIEALYQLSAQFAFLDMIQGFAWLALRHQYCQPLLSNDGLLDIKGGRHPVVEFFVGSERFFANDLQLDRQQPQTLITGPNMAGKSTFMRQVAIIALLNQTGSFVPALQAQLPIFDAIFTRVGASDDLASGQSTFMVEMSEAACILRQATSQSLVILDEVGRGTSTEDGLAIAGAILEHLSQNTKCYCLFATHYHELISEVKQQLATVKLLKTEVIENEEGIVFTHRVSAGASDSSFGVEVARLAGVPEEVIAAALNKLQQPRRVAVSGAEQEPRQEASAKDGTKLLLQETSASESSRLKQYLEVIYQIERLNVVKTTPLQALNLLHKLQGQLFQSTASPRSLFEKIVDNG